MWKRNRPVGLPDFPDTSTGDFAGKRLEESGSVTATVWEYERLLNLLLTVDYGKRKGVMLGNIAIAGGESDRRKQIADLIALLTNLMEEN